MSDDYMEEPADDAVLRDFDNALKALNEGGSIVMHDCNPRDLFHEGPHGCGTAWRAFVKIRERSDIDAIVCNFHHGTTIVQRGKNTQCLPISNRTGKRGSIHNPPPVFCDGSTKGLQDDEEETSH